MPAHIESTRAERPLLKALANGAMCRCPHCGKGKLYSSYLKVADHCDVCGEELRYHRADDFPPYIAIFIVGHLLVGWMLHAEMSGPVDPMFYVWTMVPASVVLPLAMLPSIKGMVVALQWATYMHGFDPLRRPGAID